MEGLSQTLKSVVIESILDLVKIYKPRQSMAAVSERGWCGAKGADLHLKCRNISVCCPTHTLGLQD